MGVPLTMNAPTINDAASSESENLGANAMTMVKESKTERRPNTEIVGIDEYEEAAAKIETHHDNSQSDDDGDGGDDSVVVNHEGDSEDASNDNDFEDQSGELDLIEEGEDDDESDDDESDDELCIPIQIQYSPCSDTSSLSDFDNYSEMSSSSHAIGYDTDQAHVSHIGGDLDGSVVAASAEESANTSPSAICSDEMLPELHEMREDAGTGMEMKSPWQSLISCIDLLLCNVRNSTIVLKASTQIQSISRALSYTSHWLGHFQGEGVTALRDVSAIMKGWVSTMTRMLILWGSFIFAVCKYSVVEVVEEPHVPLCYGIFYFMPSFCNLLMNFNLPHWTPKLVSAMGVFSLCSQVEPGLLHQDMRSIIGSSMPKTAPASAEKCAAHGSPETLERQRGASYRNKQACRIILRVLTYSLPFFLMADCEILVGVDGPSRLTTAYVMCLLRSSRISPVGAVSWALQVLMASVGGNGKGTDLVLLVVGASSIRMVRYLDWQQSRRKTKRG
ncbi:MAG: hypothetical protein SGILL_001431 [Bacillariaceae sp.]